MFNLHPMITRSFIALLRPNGSCARLVLVFIVMYKYRKGKWNKIVYFGLFNLFTMWVKFIYIPQDNMDYIRYADMTRDFDVLSTEACLI